MEYNNCILTKKSKKNRTNTLNNIRLLTTSSINDNYENMIQYEGFTIVQFNLFFKNLNGILNDFYGNEKKAKEITYNLLYGISGILKLIFKDIGNKDCILKDKKEKIINYTYDYIEFQLNGNHLHSPNLFKNI